MTGAVRHIINSSEAIIQQYQATTSLDQQNAGFLCSILFMINLVSSLFIPESYGKTFEWSKHDITKKMAE
jgi:hypothetical protein